MGPAPLRSLRTANELASQVQGTSSRGLPPAAYRLSCHGNSHPSYLGPGRHRAPGIPSRSGCAERTVDLGERSGESAEVNEEPWPSLAPNALPPEPPELNAEAARGLLRILLNFPIGGEKDYLASQVEAVVQYWNEPGRRGDDPRAAGQGRRLRRWGVEVEIAV